MLTSVGALLAQGPHKCTMYPKSLTIEGVNSMQEATPQTTAATDDDDARLEGLGYTPQLNRVLGLFSNFSVAFTYLSPIVGVFSLFTIGLGIAGPGYIWTLWLPVGGMLLVALVFGELASHYPISGALYQYSKYNVGRRYGWFVGWFYGIARGAADRAE